MSSVETSTQLHFEAPGPGSWHIDAVHFPRPVTRYWTEVHPEPFSRGVREFARYYGMVINGPDHRYVNGFAYSTVAPVDEAEIPERLQRAEQVWQDRVWRQQLREWDEEFKPASVATHRELQAVDPDALSDAELVDYLGRCRDHHREMIYQHMRFTAAPSVPTGDFLVHAGAWTGIGTSELLTLLRGAAPVSAGASYDLERLRTAVEQDEDA
jgi:hypothetical protein